MRISATNVKNQGVLKVVSVAHESRNRQKRASPTYPAIDVRQYNKAEEKLQRYDLRTKGKIPTV